MYIPASDIPIDSTARGATIENEMIQNQVYEMCTLKLADDKMECNTAYGFFPKVDEKMEFNSAYGVFPKADESNIYEVIPAEIDWQVGVTKLTLFEPELEYLTIVI